MKLAVKYLPLVISSILLTACGGGSGSDVTTSAGAAPGVSPANATISGTVPGTKIEAFGDNGSYYVTNSTIPTPDNGKHPFTLTVPAGVGLHLVMTMDQGTATTSDDVVQAIGFKDKLTNSKVQTRLVAGANDKIDVGDVALQKTRAEAIGAGLDNDGDGVLDSPLVLGDPGLPGSKNPLKTTDADGDGVNDLDDIDGNGQELQAGAIDSQDRNDDGIPNVYDPKTKSSDFLANGVVDTDNDGLPDTIDVNPDNAKDKNTALDNSVSGYLDTDKNKDGFPDGDAEHDGIDEKTGQEDDTSTDG